MYLARAWVNFNGTGAVAIRASGNVSSITDNGTGNYTVNFTSAMPDANYASSGSVQKGDTNDDANVLIQVGGYVGGAQTTTSIRVRTRAFLTGAADTDPPQITIAVFR